MFDPTKQLGGNGVLPGDPLWWDKYNKRTANVWPDHHQQDVIVSSDIRPIPLRPERYPIINPQYDDMACLGCGITVHSKDGMCHKCYFNPPWQVVDPESLKAANVRLSSRYGISHDWWMDSF